MARVLFLIVVTGGALVLGGWISFPPLSNELEWFILGVTLTSSIGFIVFRLRVWGGSSRTVFQARPASLTPGPSAAHVAWNSTSSFLRIVGVIITAIVVILEYYGRHDIVMRALELIVSKSERLANALFH